MMAQSQRNGTPLTDIIDGVLTRFERGQITRREMVASVALLATTPRPHAPQAAPAPIPVSTRNHCPSASRMSSRPVRHDRQEPASRRQGHGGRRRHGRQSRSGSRGLNVSGSTWASRSATSGILSGRSDCRCRQDYGTFSKRAAWPPPCASVVDRGERPPGAASATAEGGGATRPLEDVYPNGQEPVLNYRERMRMAMVEAAAWV